MDGVLLNKGQYNVTYQPNAADVDPGSDFPLGGQHYEGDTVVVGSQIPSRPGYTFLGWSENAQATQATYVGGNEFTMPGHDVVLYAI